VIASNWRRHQSGTLRGFCDLELPNGLVFKGCGVHERDGERWVSMPTRPQIDRDGKVLLTPKTRQPAYATIVDFRDQRARERFQAAVLEAVDHLLARGPAR
jgi:hypothetical protein